MPFSWPASWGVSRPPLTFSIHLGMGLFLGGKVSSVLGYLIEIEGLNLITLPWRGEKGRFTVTKKKKSLQGCLAGVVRSSTKCLAYQDLYFTDLSLFQRLSGICRECLRAPL